jgi:hypothetical protein
MDSPLPFDCRCQPMILNDYKPGSDEKNYEQHRSQTPLNRAVPNATAAPRTTTMMTQL